MAKQLTITARVEAKSDKIDLPNIIITTAATTEKISIQNAANDTIFCNLSFLFWEYNSDISGAAIVLIATKPNNINPDILLTIAYIPASVVLWKIPIITTSVLSRTK